MYKILIAVTLSICCLSAYAANEAREEACEEYAKENYKNKGPREAFIKRCMADKADSRAQRQRNACATDADDKSLKGDERKAYIQGCLAAKREQKTTPAGSTAIRDSEKTCTRDANVRKLTGDLRHSFMEDCMRRMKIAPR